MSNHIYVQDFLKQLGKKYFSKNDRYTAVIHDGEGFTFVLDVYDWDFDVDD